MMKKKTYDPTTRRIRRFILLVILAVVLPSLALTGFGLIAIDNERIASMNRMQKVYDAVQLGIGQRFNSQIDALAEEGTAPFDDLQSWALNDEASLGEAFNQFFNRAHFATNYFVVPSCYELSEPKGAVSWNTEEASLPGFVYNAFGLSRDAKPTPDCSAFEAFGDSPNASPTMRCLSAKAGAQCLALRGTPDASSQIHWRAQKECQSLIDDTPQIGRFAKQIDEIAAKVDTDPSRAADLAAAIAQELSHPGLELPMNQVEFIAGWIHSLIAHRNPHEVTRPAAGRLRAIATRRAFFRQAAHLQGELDDRPTIRAIRVNGIRRVVLARGRETMVGVELVPSGFDAILNETLKEFDVDDETTIRVFPSEEHACCGSKELTILPTFFIKTDLAWRADLAFINAEVRDRLAGGRGRLYLWVLILLVGTLVLGIGRTVYAMLGEARLSRLKTDFVSSVSHELRTPLTSIRMFIETLLMGRVNNETEQRECLEIIDKETRRLSRLTERILDFSRMEAGRRVYELRPHPVAPLIDDAINACGPILDCEEFEIEVSVEDGLAAVNADKDAMLEVLINLISNAVKYSRDERWVRVEGRSRDNWIEISVTDRGIGIAKSEQKRIFEKFYRVDDALNAEVSGSGLGLSLVKYIVSAHHGRVLVHSTPGKGSEFIVQLPREPASNNV